MPQRSKGVPLEATKTCLFKGRFVDKTAFVPARASEADARAGIGRSEGWGGLDPGGLGRDSGKTGKKGRKYEEGGAGGFEKQVPRASPGLLIVVVPGPRL